MGKGLFMGMSNAKFYGRSGLSGDDLVLDGHMPPPKAAEPLYMALERALAIDIPEDGFRPSQLFQEQATTSSIRHSNRYQHGIIDDDEFFTRVDTSPPSNA